MRFFHQTLADPLEGVGAHACRPVFQPLGRPLLMVAMTFWHMLCCGAIARMKTPRVTGDHPPLSPDLQQVVEGMKFHRFPDVLMRHRVMVLFIFNVIIDIHFRFLDVPVAPRLYR